MLGFKYPSGLLGYVEAVLERAWTLIMDAFEAPRQTVEDAPLGKAPAEDFDRLTRLAAFIAQTPLAAISLVEDQKIRFKSVFGFEGDIYQDSLSFCAKTLELGRPLIVEDASLHPDFSQDPLVTDKPGVRFYAGIPLISSRGQLLGSLSVIDLVPRCIASETWDSLTTLAQQVMLTLELGHQRQMLEEIAMGRVQSIVASAASGISMARPDGHIILANPAACRILGYSEEELRQQSFMDLTHPDDRAITGALVQDLLSGKRDSFVLDKRHLKKSGEPVWTSVSVARINAGYGLPEALIAVLEDVSDRKQMEEALRAKDTLLTMAGQMARVGGWRLDAVSKEIAWSEEVRSIHQVPPGWTPTLEQGFDFFAPEWRPRLRHCIDECLQIGRSFDVEVELITAAGKRLWVRVLGQAVRGANSQIMAVQGAIQDISERKVMLSLVTQRHHQFRQFADSMPMIVWTAEPGGHVDYANHLLFDYTGLTIDTQLNNQQLLEVIHPDDVNPGIPVWRRALEQGSEYLNEFRIRSRKGDYRWHLVRAVPLRDENQSLVKWCGTAVDIHDRKMSEEATRSLSERLVTTLESITDAFFTLNRDWQFTYLNHEAERLLLRSREDLLGKSMWEEFPDAKNSAFETHYRMAMEEQGKVSFEGFYPPLDAWFRINAYPSPDGLAVYFQNVTQQRSAQEQLRLLETCVAHMNDIVVITEAEPQNEPGPRILFVNDAFEARTGYRREEVLGRSPRFLQGPKTQRSELQRIREAMTRWEPIRAEIINYTKSGEEFWLELDLVPICDEKGWYTHWVGVERDISERKQAEVERKRMAQLEQSQQIAELASQAKSHFLATMSHEIRTPISGIIGMVDVLHQTSLQTEQVEMVDILRDSAKSLLGIIDDILDFSKIEAGKLEIEAAPLNLFTLMKSVAGLQDRFAENKRVELTFYFDPEIPEDVIGDPLRLRQVLLNLVNNAVKFSSGQPRLGQVNFRAQLLSRQSNQVRISFKIEDNGIGMSEESLAKLFSPFTQADSSTTRNFGGTGLGLTISRHLVNLMGGQLLVTSEPEKGSCFEVQLGFDIHKAVRPTESRYRLADLSGLKFVLLGNSRLMDDLASYLHADGYAYDRLATIDGISVEQNDERIWVVDQALKIKKPLPQALRVLLISRGRRRRPRQGTVGLMQLDGNLLDRYSFYDGLALLAGRSVANHRSETRHKYARLSAPSRLEAIANGQLLLVAEDNETNQKVIRRQLSLLGYTADIANDGEEALALWENGHYALLLTDLHMPKMDGFELTRQIRSREMTRGYFPIVALSANVVQGAAEECRAMGMDAYLTKPVSLPELQNTLEQWVPSAAQKKLAPQPSMEALGMLDKKIPVHPVNLDRARSLLGDDESVLKDFLQTYTKDAELLVKQIHQSFVDEDYAEVAAQAHKLKSSSRAMGAEYFGALAADLESLAKSGTHVELTDRLPGFDEEYSRVKQFIGDYVNERT